MFILKCRLRNYYHRMLLARTEEQLLTLWKYRCQADPYVTLLYAKEIEEVFEVPTKLLGKALTQNAYEKFGECIYRVSRFIGKNWEKIPHQLCVSVDPNQLDYCFRSNCRHCYRTGKVPEGGWGQFLIKAWPAFKQTREGRPWSKDPALEISPKLNISLVKVPQGRKFKFTRQRLPAIKLYTICRSGYDAEPEFSELKYHVLTATSAYKLIRELDTSIFDEILKTERSFEKENEQKEKEKLAESLKAKHALEQAEFDKFLKALES